MKTKIAKLPVLAAAASLSLLTQTGFAADWSDTEVQILHGNEYHDNGNDTDISKTLVTIQHASGYEYGRNFFFVDTYKSGSNDENSTEIYGEFYSTLSMGKTAGFKTEPGSLIKDLGLTAGINYGTKNSSFRPNPSVLLLGPTIHLNVPGFTFFNVDVLAYRDSGNYRSNGGGKLCGETATTYQVTPAWKLPFSLGSESFSFEGFVDFIGSHGTCATQLLAQPQLRWDVGQHFTKPNRVYLGFEYQYWNNKFGIQDRKDNLIQMMMVFKL